MGNVTIFSCAHNNKDLLRAFFQNCTKLRVNRLKNGSIDRTVSKLAHLKGMSSVSNMGLIII